jgi:hypothetical protein
MNALGLFIPVRYENAVGVQQIEERADRWLAIDETVAVVREEAGYEVQLITTPPWTLMEKVGAWARAIFCCPCLFPVKCAFRAHHSFYLPVPEVKERRLMRMEEIDSEVVEIAEMLRNELAYIEDLESRTIEIQKQTADLLPTMRKQLATHLRIVEENGGAPPELHYEGFLYNLRENPLAPARTVVSLEGEERRINSVVLKEIPYFKTMEGDQPILLKYPVKVIDGLFDIYLGCRDGGDYTEKELKKIWALAAILFNDDSLFTASVERGLRRLGELPGNGVR